jgi:hypothetical protein
MFRTGAEESVWTWEVKRGWRKQHVEEINLSKYFADNIYIKKDGEIRNAY